MEPQTRFHLTAAIETRRNELAAQTGLTPDARRELETHLRDTITGFQQRGLNDEESFWLARRRVGPPGQLVEEFKKADPAVLWRERVFWMACGIMIFWQLSLLISYLEDIALFHFTPGLRSFYQSIWGILAGLPLLLMGILLTRNWIHKTGIPQWLIQNRMRLLVLLVCLPILCGFAQNASILASHDFGPAVSPTWTQMLQVACQQSFKYLEYSFAPLIFIFWFLPGRNKSASATT